MILATPLLCLFSASSSAVHSEPLEIRLQQVGAAHVEAVRARYRLKCKGKPREKVFGEGRSIPLDGNAKARIWAYAQMRTAELRKAGEHRGPITRAFFDVLRALLWGFHNQHTGRCFPSYERIALSAKVHRATVARALEALEGAGVLTWQHRLVRQLAEVPGLFGPVQILVPVRTSNAYRFHDPKPEPLPLLPKSQNTTVTGIKSFSNRVSSVKQPLSAVAQDLIRSGIGRSPDDVR